MSNAIKSDQFSPCNPTHALYFSVQSFVKCMHIRKETRLGFWFMFYWGVAFFR